jgi:hypothetical protein
MSGEADAGNLTGAALAVLEDVAGGLAGEPRFRLLMAAAALRMAERERALVGSLRASAAAVLAAGGVASVEALRDGLRSGASLTPALHAALLADAAVRAAVTKPGALTADEREMVGSG